MSPLDNIWQVALALLGTVGLVLLLGFVAKRFQLTKPSQGGLLKVIDSTYLGPKEKLVLVQVADQQVLVGVAGQSMTRLAQYEAAAPFGEALSRLAAADAVSESRYATSPTTAATQETPHV